MGCDIPALLQLYPELFTTKTTGAGYYSRSILFFVSIEIISYFTIFVAHIMIYRVMEIVSLQ